MSLKYQIQFTAILLFFLTGFQSNAQSDLKNNYNLMPWPKNLVEQDGIFVIKPSFSVELRNNSNRLNQYAAKFIKRLSEKTGVFIEQPKPITETQDSVSLILDYERIGKLELNEDESYTLNVNTSGITIEAETDIGVLRGLETLLQLVSGKSSYYYIPSVHITDAPRFPWRGLLIDVARHYEPLSVIKRNLDAMAAVKLNVFHWHLTDDQGFRVEIKSYPKLHQMGSDGLFYTQLEIQEIVQYASGLGIRVIPEFDVPAHATAWLTGYPEIGSKKDTVYSIEKNAGIFNPTLDPTNPKTYEIIDAVFTEMSGLFPDNYFHIGGDENKGKDWDTNWSIQEFKKKNKLETNHDLQTYFNLKIQKILQKNNKIMMGWDEIFQPELPKNVVIHSWRGNAAMIEAAKQGYQTVLSQGYYIDLMLPAKKHYLNDPLQPNNKLSESARKNILGGEATMWGELVTPLTIDSRIWPRTAAIAERLWSERTVHDVSNMYKRLKNISFELERLGLTHIRNQEVILRNISDNQDISALKDLVQICEPLKGYTRNKGGTEYQSFSPFTLFADACTADAIDAYHFNNEVLIFTTDQEKSSLENIKKKLLKWKGNYNSLQKININPKLAPLFVLSQNLSKISSQLLTCLTTESISEIELDNLKNTLKSIQKPIVDVEVMTVEGFSSLIDYCEKEYLIR